VRQRVGDFTGALADHERARELAVRLGDVGTEARVVNSIGRAHRDDGRLAEALAMHDEARDLAALVTDPDLRAQLHIDRGGTLLAAKDYPGARDAYLAAFDFRSGDRMKQALAARGAARALHAAGDCAAAAEYWRAAVAGFGELRVPEAEEVRVERAAFDCSCASD
jgi:tetratricopeptide (TPR) repeat protein